MASIQSFADRKTVHLTTTGRKSGRQSSIEVWFVVEGASVLVQAGLKGQKGWYANVRTNPQVQLAFDGVAFDGVAQALTGQAEAERVAAIFRRKYWVARVARWFGSQIGRGKPVRIELTAG